VSTNGASWQPDPSGRHEYRWWDGTAWSDAVYDQGVERRDPVGATQPPVAQGGGYAAPSPEMYPSGGGPSGGYAPGHQFGSGQQPPGAAGTPGRGRGGSGLTNVAFAGLGVLIAVGLVVLGIAVANRGDGGGDEPTEPAANVDPRDALITVEDLPAGWTESEVTYDLNDDLICDPRPEPPEPPRETEGNFERATPSGALNHGINEYSPDFAADYLAEARRQATECGTFEDRFGTGGETSAFTATAELVTGPTLGDETVWYRIEIDYTLPEPSSHDIVICLDRHGGVVSGFVLSTGRPMTDEDRTVVEELAQSAADRLQGGAGA
jgi:hypothetical protein